MRMNEGQPYLWECVCVRCMRVCVAMCVCEWWGHWVCDSEGGRGEET